MPVEPESAIVTGCVCPVCTAALYEVVHEGTTILTCLACGGRAVSHEQVETMLAHRKGGGAAPRVGPSFARSRGTPLACPRCRDAMHRGPLTRRHPVAVNRCDRCDLVWFDRDELVALQIVVAPESN